MERQVKVQHNLPQEVVQAETFSAPRERKEAIDAALREEEQQGQEIAPQPKDQDDGAGLFMNMKPMEREPLKHIEFELDGMVIEMGTPDVALDLVVGQIFANEQGLNPIVLASMEQQAKAICHVKSINGEHVERPYNKVMLKALMNKIGNMGCEVIGQLYAKHFSPPDLKQLKVLKKS